MKRNKQGIWLPISPKIIAALYVKGAALMKQDKTVSNRGVQHYQHRFHTTSRQDNIVGKKYLT